MARCVSAISGPQWHRRQRVRIWDFDACEVSGVDADLACFRVLRCGPVFAKQLFGVGGRAAAMWGIGLMRLLRPLPVHWRFQGFPRERISIC
jgi:hypothetical protein